MDVYRSMVKFVWTEEEAGIVLDLTREKEVFAAIIDG